MSQTIDDLLAELEGAEKTAEESFEKALVSDEETEEQTKEAEEATEEESEETEEVTKEAEEATEETEEETEESEEEKTASEEAPEEEAEETKEKTASTEENLSEEQLVKIAEDMGKVMARSCYQELVAMGIMPATNDDIMVPPVSEVSMPSESPVTVAADAKEQMGKKASVVNEDTLTNIYNKYYTEENQ